MSCKNGRRVLVQGRTYFSVSRSSLSYQFCELNFICDVESLEMLLLLVWRHLAVYADEAADVPNLGASMRIAPSFNADSFRTDASRKLAPVVHKLSTMVCVSICLSFI